MARPVKTQRKIIRTWLCIIKQFLFTYRTFESFESFKNNKKNIEKLLVFGENYPFHLSNSFQTRIFRNFDHISRNCT